MKFALRNLLGFLLLAFAGVSIAVFVYRQANRPPTAAATIASTRPSARLVVYLFHSAKRCSSCDRIETLTRRALDEKYAQALRSGAIEWRQVNWDAPGNELFHQLYGISWSGVVLVKVRDGREVRHQRLDELWSMLSDETVFISTVQREVSRMMEESP